jgi:glucose/arabinose dehydrogenase/cytochrome c553
VLKRLGLGLLIVIALGALAVWLWAPPVNVPWRGLLANEFPSLFTPPRTDAALVDALLRVPDGYGLSLFASDVPNARMLRVTAAGDLLVASPARGTIYWLAADHDGDGTSDQRRVLLDGLDGPNGLDFHQGYLYVAEQGRVGRVRFEGDHTVGDYEIVIDGLPKGGNHWKKTLRFGPDGLLYLTIGSSCNVCSEADERRAAMLRYTADGKFVDIYATGLRNSAGFAWRPADGALYATDNGRDLLGDDFPPCELNRIEQGGFYGWPYANGDRVPDPDLGAGRDAVIAASLPPVFAFRPHNAPLGIVFLSSPAQLPDMRGAALVALHGSWNRSAKDGYKVVALHWHADGSISADDFMTGFLQGSRVIGRPAELAEDAAGNIYVSDDYANAVYRVSPGQAGSGTLRASVAPAPTRSAEANPAAADPRQIARGATLFGRQGCQSCHVLDATAADGRVPLGTIAQRYDHAALQAYLERPNPPMPPVADAAERAALAAFLLDRPGHGVAESTDR